MRRKLKSTAGESLAEVLVAMLIVALATMLLVVMINASASMDAAARRYDEKFYEDLSNAETHGGAGADGTVIIKNDAGLQKDVAVETFGGSGLTSYSKKEVGTK